MSTIRERLQYDTLGRRLGVPIARDGGRDWFERGISAVSVGVT